MQFYLFRPNIRPELRLHRREWLKSRVTLFRTFSTSIPAADQQPVDAVLRPIFIRKLCYKLPSVVGLTFTFIQTFDPNFVFFTVPCWQAVWRVIFKICVIFGGRFERRNRWF